MTTSDAPPLIESVRRAVAIAAEHADDVDRRGRFPSEAINALKAAGTLGAFVPEEWGGRSASIEELAAVTLDLARGCASTAMVFAMHQIQVASIVRHCGDSPWFRGYLRDLANQQRLIASVTSEAGVGGDLRTSISHVERSGDLARFEKQAPTCSYGAYADDFLTTVRRGPEARGGDQVLVLTHASQTELKQTTEWDTLGMRGTCSPGFVVRATFSPEQIMPGDFAENAAETMVPFSHVLWSHVWLGIAVDAFDRAQSFVRAQARQTPGATPPAAVKVAALSAEMAQLRATVRGALHEYTGIANEPGRTTLSTVGYAVRINNLKVAVSEAVAEVCQAALRAIGIAGYRNGGPYSVGRHLRDSQSAALMIANDRILATNANLLLVHREGR